MSRNEQDQTWNANQRADCINHTGQKLYRVDCHELCKQSFVIVGRYKISVDMKSYSRYVNLSRGRLAMVARLTARRR